MKVAWVVLTTGSRPTELGRALDSIRAQRTSTTTIVVVANGCELPDVAGEDVTVVALPQNLGVPGGRAAGLAQADADIVFFLDDDAEVVEDRTEWRVISEFEKAPDVVAVSMRLVDEHGQTARRHLPRPGHRGVGRSGPVVGFLGGACAIRREAYEHVGGYWQALFYGHEELDLAWRLIDGGGTILYLADVTVFHPRGEIGRHPAGWRFTGRNRVWVARRNLPWVVAGVHVAAWLMLGLLRAPDKDCRRQYLDGWTAGWSGDVDRQPMSWRTVWRLVRLGRPPVL